MNNLNLSVKFHSLSLIIYIYIHSFIVLFSFFLNDNMALILELSILLLFLFINGYLNKMRFNMKFIISALCIVSLLFLNILLTSYKSYIITQSLRIIIVMLLPMYLLTSCQISFYKSWKYWLTISKIMTLLLPLLYYMRDIHLISYFDIATVTHLNLICFFYYTLLNNNKMLVWILPNIIMHVLFGSRMVLLATLVVYLYLYFNKINKNKGLKKHIQIIILLSTLLLIYLNFMNILDRLSVFLTKNNLNSRNINLLKAYFSGASFDEIASGRDYIYLEAIKNIKKSLILPQGISRMRIISQGVFFHAHNAVLEIMLTFGTVLSIVILIIFVIKFLIFKEKNNKKQFLYNFYILILLSFLVRSITGTYLFTDSFFWILFSFYISRMGEIDFEHSINHIL